MGLRWLRGKFKDLDELEKWTRKEKLHKSKWRRKVTITHYRCIGKCPRGWHKETHG